MTLAAVAPISSAPASLPSRTASPAPTVDYTQFLQLLVAELQNQDPTSPTDPTQYMSQLASFSTVEQQVQTNSTLDALLSAQASSIIDGTTKGVVQSVELSTGGGAIANLTNGSQVPLGPGVTVSAQ